MIRQFTVKVLGGLIHEEENAKEKGGDLTS